MKRFLVLLLLNDANRQWDEDDVARYVQQDEDDMAVVVKEIQSSQWKTVKKTIDIITRNKAKQLWKLLGLDKSC